MLLLELLMLLPRIGITPIRTVNMPRYNLNHEDVDLLVDALQNYLVSNDFEKHPNRVISLKNRLLLKIKPEDSPSDDLDVWSVFQGSK
jgi:hypothetical protein